MRVKNTFFVFAVLSKQKILWENHEVASQADGIDAASFAGYAVGRSEDWSDVLYEGSSYV